MSSHKFRHMTQNWILILNFNWTFSKFCLLIYIYIYMCVCVCVCVCVCKDRIWDGPKLGLDFSPMSPNNEFIDSGWKNYFYSRRKFIMIAVLRALNVNKIRNNSPRHDWRSYVIISYWWTRLPVFSGLFSRVFLSNDFFSSPFL